jgi:hypothetical protein
VAGLGAAERRQAEPWLCGYAPEAESNRYRAHGMYGEFKRYFGWVGGLPRAASRRGDGGAPAGTAGPDALGKV